MRRRGDRWIQARRFFALLIALPLVLPASAPASSAQESTFQDDNQLIYVDRTTLRRNLDTLAALGVDRIRATVLWKNVAPAPGSITKPTGFTASDPAAYPVANWERYDVLAYEAKARGLKLNFNITGPSPLWANKIPPRPDVSDTFEPSPTEFAQFVAAVGLRYSGNYPDSPYVPPAARIPRVDYWSIWNEPNHSGWLTPQWAKSGRSFFERAASLYRDLVDAAFVGLQGTGHGRDTILIGETAPKGINARDVKKFLKPMVFLRALYCVDKRLRPLKGTRAKLLRCPAKASAFRKAHPGLFGATGFAHHPYELILAPNRQPPDRDFVTLASLPRLTKALDTIFRRYGSKRRLPLFLTEYGYQTKPDRLGVSFARQAEYLNFAEYLAYRNRRVRTLAQFLLVDDGEPIALTFQSGLVSRAGRVKPAFAAYRLPVHVTGRGRSKRVWALLRPAVNGRAAVADVEFRAQRSKKWRRVKRARTRNARGFLVTKVRVRGRGALRVRYKPAGGRAVSSRVVAVR